MARERHARARAELPIEATKMSPGGPVLETWYVAESGQVDKPYGRSTP